MFFSRLLRRRPNNKPLSFKPSLCVLEDRITPSWFHGWTPPVPGPATHLALEAPHSIRVGQPFTVEVEALDANNRLATGYTGTVHFTLGTADSGAALPADYAFTASNDGLQWFNVTLTAAESQKITATDTVKSTIAGSAMTTVKAAPAATHFLVEAPRYIVAGGSITITVVALDANNRVDTGYAGTISFFSPVVDPPSTGAASLPGNYTFNPTTDHGAHTFTMSFATVGTPTLTATDTTTSTITGQASLNVEAATAVTHFGVYSWGFALAGLPTDALVEALDANNHVLAGYTGTVTFSSSDGSAVLPANYTFTAADDGRHVFAVSFNTAGAQTLTATDTVTASITGSGSFWVPSFKFHFGNWNFPWW